MDRELELENTRLRARVMELEKIAATYEGDLSRKESKILRQEETILRQGEKIEDLKITISDLEFERDELAENFQVPFPSSLTELMELEELTSKF